MVGWAVNAFEMPYEVFKARFGSMSPDSAADELQRQIWQQ